MQAARGTSLTEGSAEGTDVPDRRRYVGLFALVAAVLYAADQLTKYLAVEHLTGQADKPLVGDLLQLHLTRNPGAAFSTGTAFTEVLSCVAIAAVGVVLWLSRRIGSVLWAVALGVLLAGVAGNLTDRLFRAPGPLKGHVVDFLMLPNWPIFNVADMCINVAAGLILIQAFRGIRLDGTRVARSHDADDQDAEDTA
jgi:signal peptidase II